MPESFVNETIVVPLNNEEAVRQAFTEFKDQIACVIIEPIPANNGLLLQRKEYLQFLRTICTENKTLLLFDEVISGFRVGFEGAAGYYNIQPDIITYGKIIGGGLPVGMYGASAEMMNHISPEGNVYQAGTLSGNPVAMAAGIAQLTECLKPNFYKDLESKTQFLIDTIFQNYKSCVTLSGVEEDQLQIFSIGSIFWIAFTDKKNIGSAEEIDADSMKYFRILHKELLERGVYIGPSGYEVGFVCEAHTEDDLIRTAKAFGEALAIAMKLK